MEERIDNDGRWVKDGSVWVLVEPSEEYVANDTEPEPEPVALTNQEMFAMVPTAKAKAIVEAAGGLVGKAGVVFDAVYAMPNDDPAKAPLQPIAEVLLTAALPLVT